MSTDVGSVPAPVLAPAVVAELREGVDWVGSWWPAIVLTVCAVAVFAWWSRRAHRHRRTWPLAVLAVALLALNFGAVLNAWAGYVPSTRAGRLLLTGELSLAHGGHLDRARIPVSPALHLPESDTYVYTPPGYKASGATRYPVVYLLSGTPGTSADWFASGGAAHTMDVLLRNHLVRPMIIVSPEVSPGDVSDTECLDSTKGGPQVETYLESVVVPWVDAHYRTGTGWEDRLIGGMSMGGYCALDQGLRHQDLYGTVLALEPYSNPGSGGRAMLSTQAEFDAHSPGVYLPSLVFHHPMVFFLDFGEDARGGDSSETEGLARQLRERGQLVALREEPGQEHTWNMARQGLPYGLVFASEHLPSAGRRLAPG
ncbi:MAG: alpha/beta hydrolase [Actinomycetes bacterium]